MDGAALAARQSASQRAFFADVLGQAGRVLRPAPGVLATVIGVAPDRSMPNSVLYEDPAAVTPDVLDEIAAAYEAEDVRAWTVWVRPGHGELGALLAARGHVRDAEPMLMAAEIDELDLAPRAELDLDPAPAWDEVGRLNDRAYGLPGDIEAILRRADDPATSLWVARVDGAPAGCVAVRPHRGDAEVFFVAVVPEARGRGLSGELLRRALSAARAAGCSTTGLEATALGEPVYRAMGYRSLGRFGMWELRRPPTEP